MLIAGSALGRRRYYITQVMFQILLFQRFTYIRELIGDHHFNRRVKLQYCNGNMIAREEVDHVKCEQRTHSHRSNQLFDEKQRVLPWASLRRVVSLKTKFALNTYFSREKLMSKCSEHIICYLLQLQNICSKIVIQCQAITCVQCNLLPKDQTDFRKKGRSCQKNDLIEILHKK